MWPRLLAYWHSWLKALAANWASHLENFSASLSGFTLAAERSTNNVPLQWTFMQILLLFFFNVGCVPFFCCVVLPRLDTAPRFVATSETWIKIRWLRWNGIIERPLSLSYQVEYQPSNSGEDSEWLIGPLVKHDSLPQSSAAEVLEVLVSNLTRNTFYDFRVRPLLHSADGHWTNASASPPSSPYRTRCSGLYLVEKST